MSEWDLTGESGTADPPLPLGEGGGEGIPGRHAAPENALTPSLRSGQALTLSQGERGLDDLRLSPAPLCCQRSDLAPSVIEIRRRGFFEASHRYWIDAWTDEENLRRFGPCASPYGHGHNYVVDVVVAGPVDPRSGMVLNLRDLDTALARVLGALDHRFLNADVPYFQSDQLPSVEGLARYIGREVAEILRANPAWAAVRVREAAVSEGPLTAFTALPAAGESADGGPECAGPQGIARWDAALPTTSPGGAAPMTNPTSMPMSNPVSESISLTRIYTFSAAHRLHEPTLSDAANRELFGKCNNPYGHGHTYQLDVTVGGMPDRLTGMVVDLVELDRVVAARVLSRLDHRHLNREVPPFDELNPTSENVVRVIWEWLEPACPARLEALTLHETFRSGFTLRRHG